MGDAMLAKPAAPAKLCSGRVTIDRDKRLAYLDNRRLNLSGLPLRVLEEVLSAKGNVVTRAELQRSLWPDGQRINTARRLNTAVQALREALGDTARTPALIATVRKHGYRWVEERARPKFPLRQPAAAVCL